MTTLARLNELRAGALFRVANRVDQAVTGARHRRRTFTYDGSAYHYDASIYNTTWRNERTLELPIARRAVAQRAAGRVLELGNVLGHYGISGHTVVDKYERAPGVTNADILDFEDGRGYDLVVSISTLEHIGFEEEVDDPDKPRRVVEHLRRLLAAGGRGILTFPLGYNPAIDDLVAARPEIFAALHGFRRISADNLWEPADPAALRGARYGSPFANANALIVATI